MLSNDQIFVAVKESIVFCGPYPCYPYIEKKITPESNLGEDLGLDSIDKENVITFLDLFLSVDIHETIKELIKKEIEDGKILTIQNLVDSIREHYQA